MLTVLMATHNGDATLPEVLTAYAHLEPVAGGWRLIVVDNGSTDLTRDVLAAFSQRLPLTYLFESRRGKNAALNTGLSRITGDLVVFSDDDTVPQPDWLRQIRSAADARRSFSILGGPVLPRWPSPPENWILEWVPLSPTFAVLSPATEGPIDPRLVFGPNLAIRAAVFRQDYRFDETIGLMGSETEFVVRLANAGFSAWHCPAAVVHHIIRPSQMTREWVLGRAVQRTVEAELSHGEGPGSVANPSRTRGRVRSKHDPVRPPLRSRRDRSWPRV